MFLSYVRKFFIFRLMMEKSIIGPSFEEIEIPVPFGHISGKY